MINAREFASLLFGIAVMASMALYVYWNAAAPETKVKAEDYGNNWPFGSQLVGVLRCRVEHQRPMALIEIGSTEYGLNGAAIGLGGYPSARDLVARHPEYDTYLLGDYDRITRQALSLCPVPP